MTAEIKFTRSYTLPNSREGRGRTEIERLVYEKPHWLTPADWVVKELRNAGCTRYNNHDRYVGEQPKITDFSRGEEMTVTADLVGFTQEQAAAIASELN
ncbi:hypothetical protein ABGB09_34075 [Streptomyces sp. B8F3]|uniref:hypothetical protein n=1 Tax=Streptomyces sp. B8F3 TaxID=3153573 RepID=UPI00325DABB4